jgi:hypothetical protein
MGFCNPATWDKLLSFDSLNSFGQICEILNLPFNYEPSSIIFPTKFLHKVIYDFGLFNLPEEVNDDGMKIEQIKKIFQFLFEAFYDSSFMIDEKMCNHIFHQSSIIDEKCDFTFFVTFDKILNLPDSHQLKKSLIQILPSVTRYFDFIPNVISNLIHLNLHTNLDINIVISICNLYTSLGIDIMYSNEGDYALLMTKNPHIGKASQMGIGEFDNCGWDHEYGYFEPPFNSYKFYDFFEPFISNLAVMNFVEKMNLKNNTTLASFGVNIDEITKIIICRDFFGNNYVEIMHPQNTTEQNKIYNLMVQSNLQEKFCRINSITDVDNYRTEIDDSSVKNLILFNLNLNTYFFDKLIEKISNELECIIIFNCGSIVDNILSESIFASYSDNNTYVFPNLKKVIIFGSSIIDSNTGLIISPENFNFYTEHAKSRGVELLWNLA